MKVTWGDILYSAFSLMTNQGDNSLQACIDIILPFALQSEHLSAFGVQPKGDLHSAKGQLQKQLLPLFTKR